MSNHVRIALANVRLPPRPTSPSKVQIDPSEEGTYGTGEGRQVFRAGDGSPTTSAVVDPDGTVVCFQPYGEEGILTADLDLERATGLLAKRYRPVEL